MVNLISGVVGFASGFLVLSIGINWFYDREWVLENMPDASEAMDAVTLLERTMTGKASPKEEDARKAMTVIADFFVVADDPRIARRLNLLEAPRGEVATALAAAKFLATLETHRRYRTTIRRFKKRQKALEKRGRNWISV